MEGTDGHRLDSSAGQGWRMGKPPGAASSSRGIEGQPVSDRRDQEGSRSHSTQLVSRAAPGTDAATKFANLEATIITHLTAIHARLEHIGLHIEFPQAHESTILAQRQSTAAATTIITTQLNDLEFQITTSTLGLQAKLQAIEQSLLPRTDSEVYSEGSEEEG